jgi:hypothetical protein
MAKVKRTISKGKRRTTMCVAWEWWKDERGVVEGNASE